MSKPTLPGQPNPMPTAATTTATTTQGFTTSRGSFAPVATGSHAPQRSDWTRARAPTEQAGFSMGTDPKRIGRQPGKSSPIPVPQRNAQAPTLFSAAPANTVQPSHARHTSTPQPSQADSDPTASSDEEQIDVFQALDALNRTEKKEVTKDEQQIDLLEALEEQRRLQEKISVYQMLSESPPKTVNHPEKRPDEATMQPSARPDESALTPDRQRDKLFDAVRHGDTKHANWMVKELSFTDPLDRQLPAAIPDTFIQNTWTPAQRHFSKFSTPLQMYLTHCRQLATWHQWVREVLPQHTDANALFSPALQGACDVLRTTREAQLKEEAPGIADKLGAALGESPLEQALARQPFTSIQSMLDQCKRLEKHLNHSPTLAAFRNALEVAFALQHHATEKLRHALLNDTLDEGSLKTLPMMVFARQVTTLPAEDLATRTTPEQRITIHRWLGMLLKDAMSTEGSGRRWEVTVLKRLTIQAEKATLKKTGLLSDHSGVTADDD